MKLNSAFYRIFISFLSLSLLFQCKKEETGKNLKVILSPFTNVTSSSADYEVTVSLNGTGQSLNGLCWSTSPMPTLDNCLSSKALGTGDAVYKGTLSGLNTGTTYYFRANSIGNYGTVYSNQVIITTIFEIGAYYQKGKIVYILQPGDPGYIAGETHGFLAFVDYIEPEKYWQPVYTGGSWTPMQTGATGTALGTGESNTNTIVSLLGTDHIGASYYASEWCWRFDFSGYSDWFLPSKDELIWFYTYRDRIHALTHSFYWSSSEYDATQAWALDFNSGNLLLKPKNSNIGICAYRKF